jgi:hypothetical protein
MTRLDLKPILAGKWETGGLFIRWLKGEYHKMNFSLKAYQIKSILSVHAQMALNFLLDLLKQIYIKRLCFFFDNAHLF